MNIFSLIKINKRKRSCEFAISQEYLLSNKEVLKTTVPRSNHVHMLDYTTILADTRVSLNRFVMCTAEPKRCATWFEPIFYPHKGLSPTVFPDRLP